MVCKFAISPYMQPSLDYGYFPNNLVDPAGRSRISTPLTLFEHNNQSGTNVFKWDKAVVGTGSIVDTQASGLTTLSTGGGLVNASAVRASRYYVRYQVGKAVFFGTSFNFGVGVSGVAKRVGFFDANNGAFVEQNGSTIAMVTRMGGVDTRVPQPQWNEDPLDGTGPSGIVLNPTTLQDLRMDFFGGLGIRFFLYLNGQFIPVHKVQNANNLTPSSIGTINLTLRQEIVNLSGVAGASTLTVYNSNLMSEGATEQAVAFIGSSGRGTSSAVVNTRRPIFTIQSNTLAIDGVNRNFGQIIPVSLSVLTDANIYLELVQNGVLTGASFSSVSVTSIANKDLSATVISGGAIPFNEYVTATGNGANTTGSLSTSVVSQFPLVYSSLQNTQDTLSIVATSMTGTANVAVALNWEELY